MFGHNCRISLEIGQVPLRLSLYQKYMSLLFFLWTARFTGLLLDIYQKSLTIKLKILSYFLKKKKIPGAWTKHIVMGQKIETNVFYVLV